MATITEDYVSFETAKLLVKKSFDYNAEYESYYTLGGTIIYFKDNTQDINIAPRITLQIAMKWLREVHKISIEITSTGYLIDNDVEWECDIKAGHRLYFKHITNEKSFESCAEAAIKYCLENLI